MEIEVAQEKLAKALNIVSRVAVGAKSTLPILANVLIKVENGKVSLTTTNLDMAVVDYIPVTKSSDGVATVPARLLAEFIQNLPRGEKVHIKMDGDKMKVSAGRFVSTINGVPADDFPELPEIDEKKSVIYKMGIDDFKVGISEVVIAASGDTTRVSLMGIYFNTAEDNLYVAATDGYRLAEREFINNVKSDVSAIVPASSLQEVLRSISDEMDEIEILFDDNQVRFRMGEIEITSKLIDGVFPDYRRLIPDDNEVKITLDREELMRVVKIAALFARESNRAIICKTDKKQGIFSVASIANEVGENETKIETKVSEEGEIKLDSRFLLDALNVMDGENVSLEFSQRKTPVLVTDASDGKYRHLIMPLN